MVNTPPPHHHHHHHHHHPSRETSDGQRCLGVTVCGWNNPSTEQALIGIFCFLYVQESIRWQHCCWYVDSCCCFVYSVCCCLYVCGVCVCVYETACVAVYSCQSVTVGTCVSVCVWGCMCHCVFLSLSVHVCHCVHGGCNCTKLQSLLNKVCECEFKFLNQYRL